MNRHFLTVFAVILGGLICASSADAQHRIIVIDENGSPVNRAKVTITCPGDFETAGLTDARGVFEWIPLPLGNCDVSIRSRQVEDLDAQILVRGSEAVTLKVWRRAAAAAKGCPPERVMRNGSCGTAESARAEYGRFCQQSLRGGTAIFSAGRYQCECPSGRIAVKDGVAMVCTPADAVLANAGLSCRQLDPNLVPTPLTADGGFDCKCRIGFVWEERSTGVEGKCVPSASVASANAACDRQMIGSIRGEDDRGQTTCVCPDGYVESRDRKRCEMARDPEDRNRCPDGLVELRNGTCATAERALAEASAQCGRDLPGSVALGVGKGGYNCVCPSGQRESRADGRCVSDGSGDKAANPLEKYKEFWGTWRGTKTASGITIVIRPDGTGSFTDTRPVSRNAPPEGAWAPDAKVGCIWAVYLRLCIQPDGSAHDIWLNVYTK